MEKLQIKRDMLRQIENVKIVGVPLGIATFGEFMRSYYYTDKRFTPKALRSVSIKYGESLIWNIQEGADMRRLYTKICSKVVTKV